MSTSTATRRRARPQAARRPQARPRAPPPGRLPRGRRDRGARRRGRHRAVGGQGGAGGQAAAAPRGRDPPAGLRQGPRPRADRRASSTPSRTSSTRPRSAGAKGLMQLMPETADYIAEKSGGTAFVQGDLATPQVNISYGSWYLRYLLEKYDGREILALAAYNAGEGKVDEWVAAASAGGERFRAADHIPFPETRNYVRDGARRAQGVPAHVQARAGPLSAPLAGRGALVTGVSRRAGIGYAVVAAAARARRGRLRPGLRAARRGPALGRRSRRACRRSRTSSARRACSSAISPTPRRPAACMSAAAAALGHVDVLVANHAMSCDQDLEALEAAAIDATLAVNVRATLLLVQALRRAARRRASRRPRGAVHLRPAARADGARAALRGEQGRAARAHGLAGRPARAARHPRQRAQPRPDRHRLGDAGADARRAAAAAARALGERGGRRADRRLARDRRSGLGHRPGASPATAASR